MTLAPDRPFDLPSPRYRSYVLAVMLLVYTMSYVDRVLVGLLAPLIKADLGLSDAELGLASGTAFAVLYCTFTIPFGWLADRLSRTWIIGGAFAFWSACTMLFGLGRNAVQLAIARAGVGFGEAGGGAPSHSMLIDYFPREQRARAMAIYGFGVPLGLASGAMIGGLASGALGWRGTFMLAGALGLAVALLMKLTVREPRRVVRAGTSATPHSFFKSIKLMLSKPAYLALCAGAACGTVVGASDHFWIPSYMVRSFQVPLVEVTFWYGLIHSVGGIGGAWAGGYLGDRFAKRTPSAYAWVVGASYLLAVPLYIGVLLAGDFRVALVLYFGEVFFKSFGNGPIVAATQHLATPALRGTASSILNFSLMIVGMGMAVPIVGALSDALAPEFGQYSLRYAMFILPGFYLLGGVLFAVAAKRLVRDGADKDPGLILRQSEA